MGNDTTTEFSQDFNEEPTKYDHQARDWSAVDLMLNAAQVLVEHSMGSYGSDPFPELLCGPRVQLVQGAIPTMEMVEAETVKIVLSPEAA